MNVVESYQLDMFSVIVLIAVVILMVFFIVASVYFFNNWTNQVIASGESSGLFWTSLVILVLLLGLGIYATIRIFTYKTLVVKEEIVPPVIIPSRQYYPVQPVQSVQPNQQILYSPKPMNEYNIPKSSVVQGQLQQLNGFSV